MSKISIIIPVYYNSDTLELLYNDLKVKVLDVVDNYELVMVDDGSKDDSWEVIKKLKLVDDKIVAVKLSRNYGEHAALLAGFSVCTGECAVTKQADLQEDSSLIIDMYNSWKNGNEVVLAARQDRQDSLMTKMFAGLYYKIIRRFVMDQMPSGGCDCYLLDRKVINQLVNMKEKNSSLTLQVLWTGFKTDTIYFHRLERVRGKGKWTFAKKFKLVMDSVISFSYIPIRMMWIIGIAFFVFSVMMGIDILYEFLVIGTPIAGWNSLMSVILLSAGLILWMLGMLGEYMWRTFDASSNRPPFIISQIEK